MLLYHHSTHCLREEESRSEINLNHSVPSFHAHALSRTSEVDSRVVAENVNGAFPFEHFVDDLIRCSLLRHIADNLSTDTAALNYLCLNFCEGSFSTRHNCHFGPSIDKRQRHCTTDPSTGASNHCNFAVEFE